MRRTGAMLALLGLVWTADAVAIDRESVRAALARGDYEAIESEGPSVLAPLAELYRGGDRETKIAVARTWYRLGWQSPEAKEALLEDLGTDDETLRLDVQWALGRVSADPEVVERLLDILRHDPNPLFRDKAACALASDQIHLTPAERYAELTGLVAALEDETPQIRRIALQALRILTGQTKGFVPHAPAEARVAALERWRRWLDDYRASL